VNQFLLLLLVAIAGVALGAGVTWVLTLRAFEAWVDSRHTPLEAKYRRLVRERIDIEDALADREEARQERNR
jgi:membrane protein YqaA with SNARE-associated domain